MRIGSTSRPRRKVTSEHAEADHALTTKATKRSVAPSTLPLTSQQPSLEKRTDVAQNPVPLKPLSGTLGVISARTGGLAASRRRPRIVKDPSGPAAHQGNLIAIAPSGRTSSGRATLTPSGHKVVNRPCRPWYVGLDTSPGGPWPLAKVTLHPDASAIVTSFGPEVVLTDEVRGDDEERSLHPLSKTTT
jgi:hypothetical protein